MTTNYINNLNSIIRKMIEDNYDFDTLINYTKKQRHEYHNELRETLFNSDMKHHNTIKQLGLTYDETTELFELIYTYYNKTFGMTKNICVAFIHDSKGCEEYFNQYAYMVFHNLLPVYIDEEDPNDEEEEEEEEEDIDDVFQEIEINKHTQRGG